MPAVLDTGHHRPLGRPVARPPVGDQDTGGRHCRCRDLGSRRGAALVARQLRTRTSSTRRIWLAKFQPNLSAHCGMMGSSLTVLPRAASIASAMRRLSGTRPYSHTAWLITWAGKRQSAQGDLAAGEHSPDPDRAGPGQPCPAPPNGVVGATMTANAASQPAL